MNENSSAEQLHPLQLPSPQPKKKISVRGTTTDRSTKN